MLRISSVFLLLLAGFGVRGQEFWMMPDKFAYRPGDTAVVSFQVGNNFSGEPWNLRLERVKRAAVYDATRKGVSIRDRITEGTDDHLKLPLTAGTCVMIMESNSAFIELPAERFNEYLKEYALDNATTQRKNTNTTNRPGREYYARSTKLIVQAGDRMTESYKAATGLPVEIIPEKNPATYQVGDVVHFKLYYDGKPLFGARAFVWNNNNNRLYTQPIYSQQDGTIEVRIFNEGKWMISVVWMVPAKDENADWQSYWSSLVFGVE